MPKASSNIKRPNPVGFGSGFGQMPPGSHSHGTFREWILSITLEGSTHYTLNGQTFLNRPGDMLLLSSNVRQNWRVQGNQHWSVVYMIFEPRAHWLPWLDSILQGHPWRLTGHASKNFTPTADILKQADSLRRSTHVPLSQELAMNALEHAILLIAQALSSQSDHTPTDPRVQQALAWAVNRLDQPISLEDLARSCNASRANFCRLFKRATTQAPMQYIDRLRMDRARELLSTTGLPIKQISAMVGFDDPKYFTKRFKALMGLSPSAFKLKA